ncbi:NAD(P)/FAD-dependent oxidoreductase [Mycolicibacterium hodleri]|uniref:NAD(P)/FAD-dependent oxidoreductase n=1 Tax=Mycolicibacterium hodleri TaxID=49897 RepID=A0A502DW29_9MYCO|nr:NAD(P)/FAD-dependent oxidoreductase [Mycolicibacterium hodleri]TPG29583.1 NAD(P)/FAD-dependent oxidoreductase [Mycolicibacterium hodleri]
MDYEDYDAIIVGGRCAGAATAMLLARGGMRVLVVEATRPGTDTLSTHALMRGGVLQLHRWGLLDAVVAAGTPAILSTEFEYGDEIEKVDIRSSGSISALRAPRRTVLDPLLLGAAHDAGAEIRMQARVVGVVREGDRVCGVEGVDRGAGTRFRAIAPLVIGADGRNSTIARAVDAPYRRRGSASGAIVYGYFAELPDDRYHWAYRPGVTAGVVPTSDGLACVRAGTASDRFAQQRSAGLDATFRSLLAEATPQVARSIGAAPPVGTLRAYPGQPGWIRAAAGPGWALVGDAAYFKDPITAHGITDALRDADLLARAVLEAPRSWGSQLDAITDYEHTRDRLSEPLFDITERIASYRWDLAELRAHLRDLSQAMRPEVDALLELDQEPAA